jgi:hypothetical protein
MQPSLVARPTGDAECWNKVDMHHLGLLKNAPGGEPIAVVDGRSSPNPEDWAIANYTQTDRQRTRSRMYNSSNISVFSNNSFVTAFDSDTTSSDIETRVFDNSGFKPTEGGMYWLHSVIEWDLTSSGSTSTPFGISHELRDFDATISTVARSTEQVTNFPSATFTTEVSCTTYIPAGHLVKPRMWQDSGDSQTVVSDDRFTYFEGYRIR